MSSEIRMHVNTDFNIRYYLWKTQTKKIVNFICFCRKKPDNISALLHN